MALVPAGDGLRAGSIAKVSGVEAGTKSVDELDGSEPREEAIPVLVEALGGRLHALGLRFCGNPEDAQDLVQEVFQTLIRLRDQGVTVLMVEQNAKAALAMSDYGLVLELGQTRMHEKASKLLADPRVGQLFLGGHMEEEEHA